MGLCLEFSSLSKLKLQKKFSTYVIPTKTFFIRLLKLQNSQEAWLLSAPEADSQQDLLLIEALYRRLYLSRQMFICTWAHTPAHMYTAVLGYTLTHTYTMHKHAQTYMYPMQICTLMCT